MTRLSMAMTRRYASDGNEVAPKLLAGCMHGCGWWVSMCPCACTYSTCIRSLRDAAALMAGGHRPPARATLMAGGHQPSYQRARAGMAASQPALAASQWPARHATTAAHCLSIVPARPPEHSVSAYVG
eukprot:COSAG01_NODE_12763_length_1689_cov_2.095597_1_plen_127_part_10